MVQLSPAKRLSAADYLARWQDSLFPQSFETFLRPFMRSLQVGWYCIISQICACSTTAVMPIVLAVVSAASKLSMALMSMVVRCVRAAAAAFCHASREHRIGVQGLLQRFHLQGHCRLLQNTWLTTGLHLISSQS